MQHRWCVSQLKPLPPPLPLALLHPLPSHPTGIAGGHLSGRVRDPRQRPCSRHGTPCGPRRHCRPYRALSSPSSCSPGNPHEGRQQTGRSRSATRSAAGASPRPRPSPRPHPVSAPGWCSSVSPLQGGYPGRPVCGVCGGRRGLCRGGAIHQGPGEPGAGQGRGGRGGRRGEGQGGGVT
jgi:hypothetical protein